MRHRKRGRHLGRSPSHRNALKRNLAISLFRKERIITSPEKAKEVRPFAEKIITLAKTRTLANIRRAAKLLQDKQIVRKLFSEIGPRYAERPGGYTRIIRRAHRRLGDGARTAVLELVEEEVEKAAPKPGAAKEEEKEPGGRNSDA
jgi:large subunit ribosomal protein L17